MEKGNRVRLHPTPRSAPRNAHSAVIDQSPWKGRKGTVTWVSKNDMIEVLLDGDGYPSWWPVTAVEHTT
jgi:hypothetical protein